MDEVGRQSNHADLSALKDEGTHQGPGHRHIIHRDLMPVKAHFSPKAGFHTGPSTFMA